MSNSQLIITLEEDRLYKEEQFLQLIKLTRANITEEDGKKLFREIVDLKLEQFIRYLLRSVYKGVGIESPPPSFDPERNSLNFGQWVGIYRFESATLGEEVRIRVRPKVSEVAFMTMLNESISLVEMLGTPMMDVLWTNLYGKGYIRENVAYSALLQRITEIVIRSLTPTAFAKEFLSAEGVGNFNRARSIAYLSHGVPLVLCIRRNIEPNPAPLILLARFHMRLMNNLDNEIKNLQTDDVALPLISLLRGRMAYHAYVLSTGVLSQYFQNLVSYGIEDQELLDEASSVADENNWVKQLIMLYRAYIAKVKSKYALESKLRPLLPLQPLPSSKVYELWVLSLLIRVFQERNNIKPEYKHADGGLGVRFDSKELSFNISRREWSRLSIPMGDFPRPDYIAKGENKMVAIDAKYRSLSDVRLEDIERMIAYIVYYSTPQDSEEVKGLLVTLGPSDNESLSLYGRREDITPPIKLYSTTADPRFVRNSIRNIMAVYEKVFSR